MSETFMNISNPYVGERRPGTVGLPAGCFRAAAEPNEACLGKRAKST